MAIKKPLSSISRAALTLVSGVLLFSLLFFWRKNAELSIHYIPNTVERYDYCKEHFYEKLKSKRLLIGLQVLHNFSYPIDVLDVGANIGYFFLPALACFNHRHSVLGVEPVSSNLNTMIGRLINIGAPIGTRSCNVVRGVMADENGRTLIHVPGNRPDNAALSKDSTIVNIPVPMSDVFNESVPILLGDDLLRKHHFEPTLIKVDVQGSEIRVFMGMKEYLSKNRDIIIVTEQDNRLMRASGYEPAVVYRFLRKLNFRAFCNPFIIMKRKRPMVEAGIELKSETELIKGVPCPDIVYYKQKKTIFSF